MSKKIFKVCYFKHDFNARSDSKISRLLMSLGWEGYGLYWAIVEKLYEAGGRIENDVDALAFDLRSTPDALSKIISDFGLFFVEDGMIASKSVDRRIVEMSGKSKQSKLAAEERWRIAREKQKQSERIAGAMPEEKSKVEKSKEDDTVRHTKTDWPGFETFWKAYPNKTARKAALLEWNKIRPDEATVGLILAAIGKQSRSEQWTEWGGKYIPHARKWLHNEQWNDELKPAIAQRPPEVFVPTVIPEEEQF